jgi:PTS system fructose-specific IIC component
MELGGCLKRECVVLLRASTKRQALEELVQVLAAGDIGVSREALGEAVWKREKLMSTGIGHGIAVPHVRLPGVKRLSMAVGVSRDGVKDYVSLDQEPVHLVVMIAAPQGDHEGYIRLLAKTVEVLKEPEALQAMVTASEAESVYEILTGGRG